MDKFIDYYKMLQVHHEANQEVINAAYRCFSKMYHPDVNGNKEATEQMKMINVAYNTIGNLDRRVAYHRKWLRGQNGNVARTIKERPSEGYDLAKVERQFAKKVLDSFFDDLTKEEWEKSYQKLTAADKNNIPLDEYIEWKDAVSQLYKLGNYKVEYFCAYENCEYAGTNYSKILHFSITLTEMETATGKINQEQTQKYVAKENGAWRVCLGYTDLKSSIRKFKYLAKAFPKAARDEIIAKALDSIDPLTGIYSRRGFIEQAGKELRRCERYGNPLSLGVAELRPTKGDEESFEREKDIFISNTSEILSRNARQTDIVGRSGDTSFAVLFIETKIENAKATMTRLLNATEVEGNSGYEIYWNAVNLFEGNFEDLLEEAFKKVILKERAATVDNDSIKLGKYHLSDILEFNKKGRNHF